MKLHTFQYIKNNGWSVKRFPDIDSEKTLIFLFAAPQFIDHAEPLIELQQAYPKSKIIGCSTSGEIFGANLFDHSITVAILQFEKTFIRIVKSPIHTVDGSFHTGKDIAAQLENRNLKGIFVLCDGLQINGSDFAKGLNTVTDKKIVITGGLAGDGSQFKRTWTIFNSEILTHHAVGIGFYGEHVHLAHASQGGWNIFGPERRITYSKNNILFELDDQPALALYKEYLGERADGLPATGLLYPLSIRENAVNSKPLVRTILGIDEKSQSLIFAGDMPTGYLAQLMRANFDRLIISASEAGAESMNKIMQNVSLLPDEILTIAISCVGRRLVLGERTEEEIESTLETLPSSTRQVGFYSYGELSPSTDGVCSLHNQTMTLTTFYEN